ncbi:MAG: hypothetical protein ACYDDF_00275 [Thermoplasmatota archaeon]
MAPFLRDEGPPVSSSTIQEARETLPTEYGYKVVHENGRGVLIVRSPRARPDYLHELEEAALYVPLEDVKDVRDVLLVGSEKVCRLEPLGLRDHIRSRLGDDRTAAEAMMKALPRDFGFTLYRHPEHPNRVSIGVRIPRGSVSELTPEDVQQIKARIQGVPRDSLATATAAYIIADVNFERLGRRVFFELVDPAMGKALAPAVAPVQVESTTLVAPSSGGAAAPFVPMGGSSSGSNFGGGNAWSSSPMASLISGALPAASAPPVAHAPTFVPGPAPAAAAPATRSGRPTPPPKELISSDENVEVYVRKTVVAAEPAPVFAAPQPPPAPAAAPYYAPPAAASPPATPFFTPMALPPAPALVAPPAAPAAPPVAPPIAPAPVMPAPAEARMPFATPALPSAPQAGPAQDNGQRIEPSIQQVEEPPQAIARHLASLGYEVVAGVTIQGTAFDLAAHRKDGKRLLVKRVNAVTAAEIKVFDSVTKKVAADACLLIVDRIDPALRLAAWGTSVQLASPSEAARLLSG